MFGVVAKYALKKKIGRAAETLKGKVVTQEQSVADQHPLKGEIMKEEQGMNLPPGWASPWTVAIGKNEHGNCRTLRCPQSSGMN